MSEVEMEQETTPQQEEVKPIAGIGTLVFGKWDASEVTCKDPGLAPYINLTTVGVPHTDVLAICATDSHDERVVPCVWRAGVENEN